VETTAEEREGAIPDSQREQQLLNDGKGTLANLLGIVAGKETYESQVEEYADLLNNQGKRHTFLWVGILAFEKSLWASKSFAALYPSLMMLIDQIGAMIGAANRESKPTMFQQSVPQDGDGQEAVEEIRTNLRELGFTNAMDVMDYAPPEMAARLTPLYVFHLRNYVEGIRFDCGEDPTPETDRIALERIRPVIADLIVRTMHSLEASRSTKEQEAGRTIAFSEATLTGMALARPDIAQQVKRMQQEVRRAKRGRRTSTTPQQPAGEVK
jgi:hypothetical protein